MQLADESKRYSIIEGGAAPSDVNRVGRACRDDCAASSVALGPHLIRIPDERTLTSVTSAVNFSSSLPPCSFTTTPRCSPRTQASGSSSHVMQA